MGTEVMEEVLKSIGWEAGFRLPVANEENQALEQELAFLLLKKGQLSKELQDKNERFENMQEHVKFVKQQSKQNQILLDAYRQQRDNENHKYQLALAERNNVKSSTRQMKNAIAEIEQRLIVKKADLGKGAEKLEKLKAETTWDEEAMKAWEEALKKRDEDNEILKRFTEEDRRKALDLEAKRQNLQSEVLERSGMLVKMSAEIKNTEMVMLRTVNLLKQVGEERAGLVRQWQEAVRNLRQRDQDIARAHNETENLQQHIVERREKLNEVVGFLTNERNNNRKLEFQIEEANSQNSKVRREYYDAVEEVAMTQSEAQIRGNEVSALGREIEQMQVERKNFILTIEAKKVAVERMRAEIEEIEQKRRSVEVKFEGRQKQQKQLEGMIRTLQSQNEHHILDIQTIEKRIYSLTIDAFETRNVVSAKQKEVESLENTLVSIRRRFKKEQQELIRQKQRLNDLEMKVACADAKLGNLEGQEKNEENVQQWNNRLKELEISLSEQLEIKGLLNGQILNLQKETLRLVSNISSDQDSLGRTRDKLQSNILMFEGGLKQLSAAKLQFQKKQVEENVLKLKVDKLQKAMAKQDKEIYNLQKYRLELETVLKERHAEISTACEVLFAKKKNLDEDRNRLRADIALRKVKIEQLRNKYELSIGLLGKDDSGQPLTMTHFKIKNAQEKFMLKQEGDELDQKVRKAESEIVAMENTLKIVNATNGQYKKSLEFPDDGGAEEQQLKEWEAKHRERESMLRVKKRELANKEAREKELLEKLKELEKERDMTLEEMHEKEEAHLKMEKDETDRNEKIKRADHMINNYKKRISHELLEKYDRDLYIRQLQETSKDVLYRLADFVAEFSEALDPVRLLLQKQGLQMPRSRTSFSSVSSDSVKSPSVSSGSSTNRSSSTLKVTNLEFMLDVPGSSSKGLAPPK